MDTSLPLELRNTASKLIQVLEAIKASTRQLDSPRFTSDAYFAVQRFLHQLSKVPGGADECERRAALIRTPSKFPNGQALQSAWKNVRSDIERERFRLKRWVNDQTAGTRGREPDLPPSRRSRKIERAIEAQRALRRLTDFGRQILNLPDAGFEELSVFNLQRTIDLSFDVSEREIAADVAIKAQALHDAATELYHEAEDLAAEGCLILQKLRVRGIHPFQTHDIDSATMAVTSLCDWASGAKLNELAAPPRRTPKRPMKRGKQNHDQTGKKSRSKRPRAGSKHEGYSLRERFEMVEHGLSKALLEAFRQLQNMKPHRMDTIRGPSIDAVRKRVERLTLHLEKKRECRIFIEKDGNSVVLRDRTKQGQN